MVFDIRRFSIHDGPGIRTTVFFKGCFLRCQWCHNPEGLTLVQELIYRENRCILCRHCVEICSQGAIYLTGNIMITANNLCTLCGDCARVCPTEAREIVGRTVTVAEVMAEVEKDTLFYDESGGGVTFSGGEPLMQPEFLLALLQACKEKGIHAALDTTGFAAPGVLECISPYVDLFLYDLKLMDDDRHREFAGVSNDTILANLQMLSAKGHAIAIRVPIIPGITDGDDNIGQIGAFVAMLPGPPTIAILPYHKAGVEKFNRLGRTYQLAGIASPSAERMDGIKTALEHFGLSVTVGG